MSEETARNLSNSFLAVRLIGLHERRVDDERGLGPFLVAQRGIDPDGLEIEPADYLLTRDGTWLAFEVFLGLGWDEGRDLACFPDAAEVMRLLEQLPPRPKVERRPAPSRGGNEAEEPACGEVLQAAVLRAVRGGNEIPPSAASRGHPSAGPP